MAGAADAPGDQHRPEEEEHDSTDQRMAELLKGTSGAGEMRRRLQAEESAETDDLLGRVNALEFVDSLVGEAIEIPERLGGYRIQGLLGRGGMGTVYKAWQEQLDRVVALKVLSSAWSADPTMRSRFRAEAKATAALHHQHIVPIYDYGETQGCLYFAMEKVDGVSLDRHIAGARRVAKAPMEPLDAARRFAGVADALGLAHRRRIQHRDVKPGNILVGADGTLALTDFGLAKILDRVSMHLTSKSGGFLGTLHYASPEQALGRELTPASDLYSLGVTLFEAITGDLPLKGKTTEAMLHAVLEGRPRRLRECMHRPPRDLDLVIDKLLSKEPGDRYQEGEALSRDLQRIADGEPVQIRRQSPFVLLLRRMRKNPVLSGAIIATVLLLSITVGLWRGLSREKGQSLLSRHENRLMQIAGDVKFEPGPAWGPDGLLQGLCGVVLPPVQPGAAVLGAMELAAQELPDDPAPEAMRRAYVEDPLPEATELLRQGRGHEAHQRFSSLIEETLPRRGGSDHSVEFRLYRLYLGRAIANLMASVGSVTNARMDLALASFLRPGARFPLILTGALDVAQGSSVPRSLERLADEYQGLGPETRFTIGHLLRTLAALRSIRGANLMVFDLAYPDRRAMEELGERWIAAHGPGAAESAAGLGSLLAATAREAVGSLGRAGALQMLLQGGRRILEVSAHRESPLQGWRAVFHLLEQPAGSGEPVDSEGRELSPLLQLAGWARLLELDPPAKLLELLLPRFEQLRREHADLPGLTRVAALIHGHARSQEAASLAASWVAEAPVDPEALLCRMEGHLGTGRIDRALDDAMAAVQWAIDSGAASTRVIRSLENAAAVTADARDAERLRGIAVAFREAGS